MPVEMRLTPDDMIVLPRQPGGGSMMHDGCGRCLKPKSHHVGCNLSQALHNHASDQSHAWVFTLHTPTG